MNLSVESICEISPTPQTYFNVSNIATYILTSNVWEPVNPGRVFSPTVRNLGTHHSLQSVMSLFYQALGLWVTWLTANKLYQSRPSNYNKFSDLSDKFTAVVTVENAG